MRHDTGSAVAGKVVLAARQKAQRRLIVCMERPINRYDPLPHAIRYGLLQDLPFFRKLRQY